MTETCLPDWPEEMTTKTLAAYMNYPSPVALRVAIKRWPDFPKPSPFTKRRSRRQVNEWLADAHGFGRSVSADRHRLNEELGIEG